jgi:hypothetical protein
MKRLIVLALLILIIPFVQAADAPPGFPQEFRGEISYFDEPIDGSFTLVATISDVTFRCPVDEDGRYGYASSADKCLVDGVNGDDIEFYISGSKVGEAEFHTSIPGDYTRKDFDVDDILISSEEFPIDFSDVSDLNINTNLDGLYLELSEKNTPTAYGDSDVFFMNFDKPVVQFDSSFSEIIQSFECSGNCGNVPLISFSEPSTGRLKTYMKFSEQEDVLGYLFRARVYPGTDGKKHDWIFSDWYARPNTEYIYEDDVKDITSVNYDLYYWHYVTDEYTGVTTTKYTQFAPDEFSYTLYGEVDIDDFVDTVTGVTVQTQDENDMYGYTLINDLMLTSGVPKTLYMDKVSADANYLCVVDSEIDSILDISSDCTATGEHQVPLAGGEVDGYTITLIDGGDRYKIEGLALTAVKEIILENPHKIAVLDIPQISVTVKPNTFTVVSRDVIVTNNHALNYDNLYFKPQDLIGKWTVNQNVKLTADNLEDLPSETNTFSISSGESKTFKLNIIVPKQSDLGTAGLVGGSISLYRGATFIDKVPIELSIAFDGSYVPSSNNDDDDDDDDSDSSDNSGSSYTLPLNNAVSNPTTPVANVPVETMNQPYNAVTGAIAANPSSISVNFVLGVIVFWLSVGVLTFSMLLRAKVRRVRLARSKRAVYSKRRK